MFATREKLVAADNDDALDIYVRAAGTTYRVSGGQVNGNQAIDVVFKKYRAEKGIKTN